MWQAIDTPPHDDFTDASQWSRDGRTFLETYLPSIRQARAGRRVPAASPPRPDLVRPHPFSDSLLRLSHLPHPQVATPQAVSNLTLSLLAMDESVELVIVDGAADPGPLPPVAMPGNRAIHRDSQV